MRILFYQKSLQGSEIYSENVHIMEVLNHISKAGHSVVFADGKHYDILTYSQDRKLQRSVHPKSIRWKIERYVRTSPFRGEGLILLTFIREINLFFLALKTTIRFKPDLIYRRNNILGSEYTLSRIFKIPCIKEVNGIDIDEAITKHVGDGITLRIIDSMEKRNLPRADKHIVVTAKLKDVLIEDYKISNDKIVVIGNGANTDLFKPMDESLVKVALNLNVGDRYICWVGGLAPWQGVEYFISSMPHIIKEYPNARALVVGEGETKGDLIDQSIQLGISDKVIFAGRVPYEKVPCYINASDICVAPFTTKRAHRIGASPLKINEYLSCGKPVIASRIAGLEAIESHGCGYLLDSINPQEIAQKVIILLLDSNLRQRMGENGRTYVLENHSWESVSKKVIDVCEKVIEKRKNR